MIDAHTPEQEGARNMGISCYAATSLETKELKANP